MFTTTPRSGARVPLVIHAALLCVALAAVSCNSSSGGRKAFTVTETTPADGATDVSPDAAITVRFSADLAGETVTTESFTVTTADGMSVAGDYFFDARTAMFRPATSLPEEETVRVVLSSAIESVSAVPLEPLTFDFTVGVVTPPEEEEPPEEGEEPVTLIAVQPPPFAPAVEPDAAIEIDFSAPVESSSVNDETVWVSGTTGGRYAVTVQIAAPDATSARIISTQDWLPGEIISVSILDGVTPADGAPFAGYTYSFRVATAAATAERLDGDLWIAPGVVQDFRLGDLDRDSHLDLVYHVEGGSTVEALRRLGDEEFSFPGRINVGQLVTSLELADLDGDGDSDLIVGSPDRAYTYLSSYNGFALAFTSGESYVTRSTVHAITVADIDHRGGLDAVLNTATGIQVFLDGEGSDPVYSIGGTRLSNTPVRCVDLDLDGRLDLVYGTMGFNLITYHLAGPAPGEFGGAVSVILSGGAADVSVGDFTGDGRPDLLALLSLVDAGESPISMLPQFGDLEFAGASLDITLLASQSEERMILADLEGQGSPGILWVDRVNGAVARLPANPAMTPPWSERLELDAGPASGPVQAADVDGDGRIDVAFASGNEIRFLVSRALPPPPPPPENELSLSADRIEVRQGDEGVASTVRLSHSVDIQGATLIVGYDPLVVNTPSVDVTGSAFETVEFTTWELIADPPAIHLTALVDVELPIEGLSLPPAEDRALFKVRYDVPSGAPLGESTLDFLDHINTPSVSTGFIVGAEMLPPTSTEAGPILVQEPLPPPSDEPNQISIETMAAAPGTRVRIPVVANTERELQGFTVVASFDPSELTVESLDLVGSFTETLAPDFVSPTIKQEEGFFFIGVAFDLLFEGEPKVIPPGKDYILFYIEVDVNPGVLGGQLSIALTDGLSDPPLDNLFTAGGQSFFPKLVSGGVQIMDPGVLTFVRGDSNNDASVDVSDPIFLTGCLFNSRSCPDCDDAADVNDDGRVDIADPIYLLNYVFRGGSAPMAPGPMGCGLDPTEDDLPCASVTSCNS